MKALISVAKCPVWHSAAIALGKEHESRSSQPVYTRKTTNSGVSYCSIVGNTQLSKKELFQLPVLWALPKTDDSIIDRQMKYTWKLVRAP